MRVGKERQRGGEREREREHVGGGTVQDSESEGRYFSFSLIFSSE